MKSIGKERSPDSRRGISEERFRQLAEKVPVLINAITKEAVFTFWNKTCEEVTGYCKEEIIGNPEAMKMLYPDKSYRDQLAIDWQESGFQFHEREAHLRAKDGSLRYIVWTNLSDIIGFSEGDTWAVGLNITDSKIAEQSLREEQAFLQVILNLATDFINVPLQEFDNKIRAMLARIGEYTKVDRVYVNRHDYSREVTSETHEWCAKGVPSQVENSQAIPFQQFEDVLTAMQQGEIIHIPVVADLPPDKPLQSILEEQDVKSLVAIPMFHETKNTGFVGFSVIRETRTFTEKEKALVKVSAEIIANAFSRKQVEEALRQNEERLRQIIDLVPHFIFAKDSDGRFILVNKAVAEAYGTTVDELTGMTDADFAQSEDEVRHFRKRDLAVIESGMPDYTPVEKITDSQGRARYLSTTKIPFIFSGSDNPAVLGVSFDITDRKHAEEALIESENRYREILETIEDGYYETDLKGNIIFCNNSLGTIFGYSRDELVGKSYKKLSKNPNLAFKTFNRVYQTGIPEKAVGWVIERKDKREIFVELSITLRRGQQGNPNGFRGVARDITERKKVEETLRYLSSHDPLTGLYNRSYTEEQLNRINTSRQLPITVIMADLNGLKMINDTYGHAIGDEMLKEAAAVIKSCCRAEDITARWGGDEFVILLPLTGAAEGEEICRRITAGCHDIIVKGLPLSIALGMASMVPGDEDMLKVLHQAEDDMYKQKLAESRSARSAVLNAFLKTLAAKSSETEVHTRRMKEVALAIGRKINLPESELTRLELLVTLHDIGKINISEDILTRKERLSPAEWEIMKRHPEMGYRITRATEDFAHVANDILAHHECWDGTGYPQGLKGKEIPLLARITAIADAFEVMTNGRPYKKSLPRDKVITELKSCTGTRFDPELIKVFLALLPEI